MATILITRHAGTRAWLARTGCRTDRDVTAYAQAEVREGDVVIGNLPLHLVAEVCALGARYLHVVVEHTHATRGTELSADTLTALQARLQEYRVLWRAHAEATASASGDAGRADPTVEPRCFPVRLVPIIDLPTTDEESPS